jgi:hypothetical protein
MIKAGVACSGLPAQTNMFSGPRHIVSGAHERLWLFRSWPRATSFRPGPTKCGGLPTTPKAPDPVASADRCPWPIWRTINVRHLLNLPREAGRRLAFASRRPRVCKWGEAPKLLRRRRAESQRSGNRTLSAAPCQSSRPGGLGQVGWARWAGLAAPASTARDRRSRHRRWRVRSSSAC